jgi:hypothetical protein
MQVHVFMAPKHYGFTSDETGLNLPDVGAPWQKFKVIRMERGEAPRIGVSADEVLDAIEEDGFYLQRPRS